MSQAAPRMERHALSLCLLQGIETGAPTDCFKLANFARAAWPDHAGERSYGAGNGVCGMKRAITALLIALAALSLAGCGKRNLRAALSFAGIDKIDLEPVVSTSNAAGGVIRFSESQYYKDTTIFGGINGLGVLATGKCEFHNNNSGWLAVPIGFYKITYDEQGRDQVMTYECKKVAP